MIKELSNAFADAVAAASPSVVQVAGRSRPASGLVYANEIVITTMRAIRREDGLQVRDAGGRAFDVELLGWDPATGLAVLKAAGLDAAPIAPSPTSVRVGNIGLAVARSWTNAVSASAGIVAVIGGPLRTGPRLAIEQVFRTTAQMHEGFAGGAFVDPGSGLIGVATSASIRGFGVIIPAPIAWAAAASVLEHGRVKRGFIGIAGQPVTLPDHQRGDTGRTHGVLIVAVTPQGPAAQAGLLVGDVLLAIDDAPIESPEDLLHLLATTGAGHRARVRLLRGTAGTELTVDVGEQPPQ